MNWITSADMNDGFNGNSVFRRSNAPLSPPVIEHKTATLRNLVLVIDCREGRNDGLITKIEQRMRAMCLDPAVKIRRAQMDLFDFQFVIADDPSNTNFGPCFERKTASDLAGSIKDGRFTEQKRRMQMIPDMPVQNKVYIYEGNLLGKWWGIDPKALLNASLLPPMKGEAEIQLTQNTEATADIIVQWLIYLEHLDDKKLVSRNSYAASVQTGVKKKDIRDNNRLALMLSEFAYGITGVAADVIARNYDNSLSVLQMAFLEDQKETLKKIANLKYKVNGHDTKVGPAAAKKVLEVLDINRLRLLINAAAEKPSGSSKPTPSRSKKAKSGKDLTFMKDDDDDDDDDVEVVNNDDDDDDDDEHNHNNARNSSNNNNNNKKPRISGKSAKDFDEYVMVHGMEHNMMDMISDEDMLNALNNV